MFSLLDSDAAVGTNIETSEKIDASLTKIHSSIDTICHAHLLYLLYLLGLLNLFNEINPENAQCATNQKSADEKT